MVRKLFIGQLILVALSLFLASCTLKTTIPSDATAVKTPSDTKKDTNTSGCAQPSDGTYYVSIAAGSDAEGLGSVECPYASIQTAIDAMVAAGVSGEIHVAAGTYEVTEPIEAVEGISLLGGYSSTDWNDRGYMTGAERNDSSYKTIVQYIGTNEGAYTPQITFEPSYTIGTIGADITDATIIEGFTIEARETGTMVSGLNIQDGADPTIRYNTIKGGTDPVFSAGISIIRAAGNVSNNSLSGGNSSDSSYAVFAGACDLTLTNNKIDGGTSSRLSDGVLLYYCNSAEVSSNDIAGGVATTQSDAINVQNSSATISQNTLNGGVANGGATGGGPRGIRVLGEGATPVIITENQISAGSSANADTTAISVKQATAYISNNQLDPGAATLGTARGINMVESSEGNISANTMIGGLGASGDSIRVYNTGGVKIFNNIIVGPTATSSVSVGVNVNGTASPLIANNTIISGTSPSLATGVYMDSGTSGTIENNILYGTGSGSAISTNHMAVTHVKNNDFYLSGTGDIYYDGTSFTHYKMGDLAAFQSSGVSDASNNLALNPVLAVGDYRLQAGSPVSVKTDGLDLSTEGFTVDKDNAIRIVPWSIGAYEYN